MISFRRSIEYVTNNHVDPTKEVFMPSLIVKKQGICSWKSLPLLSMARKFFLHLSGSFCGKFLYATNQELSKLVPTEEVKNHVDK